MEIDHVSELAIKLITLREKKFNKIKHQDAPSDSHVRLFKSLQKLCIRFKPINAAFIERVDKERANFNDHEKFWFVAGSLA